MIGGSHGTPRRIGHSTRSIINTCSINRFRVVIFHVQISIRVSFSGRRTITTETGTAVAPARMCAYIIVDVEVASGLRSTGTRATLAAGTGATAAGGNVASARRLAHQSRSFSKFDLNFFESVTGGLETVAFVDGIISSLLVRDSQWNPFKGVTQHSEFFAHAFVRDVLYAFGTETLLLGVL